MRPGPYSNGRELVGREAARGARAAAGRTRRSPGEELLEAVVDQLPEHGEKHARHAVRDYLNARTRAGRRTRQVGRAARARQERGRARGGNVCQASARCARCPWTFRSEPPSLHHLESGGRPRDTGSPRAARGARAPFHLRAEPAEHEPSHAAVLEHVAQRGEVAHVVRVRLLVHLRAVQGAHGTRGGVRAGAQETGATSAAQRA